MIANTNKFIISLNKIRNFFIKILKLFKIFKLIINKYLKNFKASQSQEKASM